MRNQPTGMMDGIAPAELRGSKDTVLETTPSFGGVYAGLYDAIYHDKDYAGECDLVERLFAAYGPTPLRRILDLGCGTGRHTEQLVGRGYEVVGVDRSAPMLAQARARLAARCGAGTATFHGGDIRTFRSTERFDAALMMFAVLSYQTSDDDVRGALRTARTQLREGGLLLFDCWYGPAVLAQKPTNRTKTVTAPEGPVTRRCESQLDKERCTITIRFHVEAAAGHRDGLTDEIHEMRYFHPKELAEFLSASRFAVQRVGGMPEFDREPDESTWSILVAARAV